MYIYMYMYIYIYVYIYVYVYIYIYIYVYIRYNNVAVFKDGRDAGWSTLSGNIGTAHVRRRKEAVPYASGQSGLYRRLIWFGATWSSIQFSGGGLSFLFCD